MLAGTDIIENIIDQVRWLFRCANTRNPADAHETRRVRRQLGRDLSKIAAHVMDLSVATEGETSVLYAHEARILSEAADRLLTQE